MRHARLLGVHRLPEDMTSRLAWNARSLERASPGSSSGKPVLLASNTSPLWAEDVGLVKRLSTSRSLFTCQDQDSRQHVHLANTTPWTLLQCCLQAWRLQHAEHTRTKQQSLGARAWDDATPCPSPRATGFHRQAARQSRCSTYLAAAIAAGFRRRNLRPPAPSSRELLAPLCGKQVVLLAAT